VTLEVLGAKGLTMALESSDDLSKWNKIKIVIGEGNDSPVTVTITPPELDRNNFLRLIIN
jgi:hypothetical protein